MNTANKESDITKQQSLEMMLNSLAERRASLNKLRLCLATSVVILLTAISIHFFSSQHTFPAEYISADPPADSPSFKRTVEEAKFTVNIAEKGLVSTRSLSSAQLARIIYDPPPQFREIRRCLYLEGAFH